MADLKWTIVQNLSQYDDYPFECLDESVVSIFESALTTLPKTHQLRSRRFIKLFECYLQITGQHITVPDLSDLKFHKILSIFIGALYSKRFINLYIENSYAYCNTLIKLLLATKNIIQDLFDPIFDISSTQITQYVKNNILIFEQYKLNEEKVWLWQAWRSTNRNNKNTFFQLYPLYEKFGRSFTQSFFELCDDYFSARKADKIDCITSLSNYVKGLPNHISSTDLQNPQFVGLFWRNFFAFFIQTGYASGNQVSTLIAQWRRFAYGFVEAYLIESGLFVKQWGELPSPDPRKVSGAKTHIKITAEGHEIQTKLLTHIPLQVSDSVAMQLLFQQIEDDVKLFTKWARWAVNDIWQRYERRIKFASEGTVRHVKRAKNRIRKIAKFETQGWIVDKNNPDCLKNASAAFHHYGFLTNREETLSLIYPTSLPQIAHDLALPIAGALLPHCILLVAEHPEITPSFLEKLELFDKNGKKVGFVEGDGGWKLVSHKDRRGSKNAQQIISLKPDTSELIEQVIALTNPLRDYLKAVKDDNWRYLFLTCKRGFGYPSRITKFASYTSGPRMVDFIATSLGNTSTLTYEVRQAHATNFSLPALRASAGVLVYLETKSVDKMAKALGHLRYDHRLVRRYLPEPLQLFFQERWIRIFQEKLIIEALKNSKFLLEACSFSSMEELDDFLRNNVLKLLKDNADETTQLDDSTSIAQINREVVFGINTQILTLLISLQIAVENASERVSATAKYWSCVTKHVVGVITYSYTDRDDLQSYLKIAQHKSDPALVEHLIYA